jgi:AsmA protein
MKKGLMVTGVVIVVLILIAIIVPSFIDANHFKPELESDLASALGRNVQIGDIKLRFWSGAVTVDNVSIADDPAFSTAPFLTATNLKAGVALIPLVFSKKLDVLSFTIDAPQVSIIRNSSGVWNFSSLGSKSAKSPASGAGSSPSEISIQKLALTNGKMSVTEAGGKVRAYDGVNVTAENVSYTSQFPFEFSANTPGGGTIKLSGQAGPIDTKDAAMTPFHATIDVSHFDLASTGFVDPSSGLGGLVNFSGHIDSDGKLIVSNGTVTATNLKLTAGDSPSTAPLNVDYETMYDPKKQDGTLKTGNIHVGKASANLTGMFDAGGPVTTVNLKLTGQGMSVPDLEGLLPAVGVKLPSGASLQSGSLNATLSITGPMDKLVIEGPIDLSNGKMAGFSLSGALGALNSFTGLGKSGGSDTEIQTLKADMHIDPSGQQARNMVLVVPSIGTVTGNGQASANGDLDCKMVASLSGAGGALSDVLGGGKSKGIPFDIKGTTSHPEFVPDVGGMAKGFLTGAAGSAASGASSTQGAAGAAAGALGGLLGKKKTQ